MSKKHDENKDLRLVSRVARIDYAYKTIEASKSTTIGIKTLGRIDYLVNYCGWTFVYNNDIKVRHIINSDSPSPRKREIKKEAKLNTKTNKRKK